MDGAAPAEVGAAAAQAAARHPALRLLLLFGSRGRGDAAARSHWDFA